MNARFKEINKLIGITGITPTKHLTLGNYLGVIKEMLKNQDKYSYIIFIADLHSLTSFHKPNALYENRLTIAATYLALGLDLNKNIIFAQSENLDHTYLAWLLSSYASLGVLQRMTQYKDKVEKLKKQKNNTLFIPSSLLFYPNLMAADILLYQPDCVFVGNDQVQHLEFTKNIAQNFNKLYKKEIFKIFNVNISKTTSKIKNLQNPERKMSKSDINPNGNIFLLDDPKIAKKKIISAVTDSENKIYYDIEKKPGISNLLNIYSGLTDLTIDEIVKKYKNSNYYQFKLELSNIVEKFLIDFQLKFNKVIQSNKIRKSLQHSIEISKNITSKKIIEINNIIGLNQIWKSE